ncbi:MAG TPA: hypothetical protein VKS98_08195 [Chthoniobacterales bacterium]|nr:hypothetical protein [Chthoniobacterales bacterium]
MAGLVFLTIGVICALIGRILLIGAAFNVSVWWGIGVLLPFGPLLFRLSYPDVAPTSRYFRLAVLPCFLGYFYFQPTGLANLRRLEVLKSSKEAAAPTEHYAMQSMAQPTAEQRRDANQREFERLNTWSQSLRLKKRDLLHSDVKGNVAYDAELAQYEAALTKATAEKQALYGSAK